MGVAGREVAEREKILKCLNANLYSLHKYSINLI